MRLGVIADDFTGATDIAGFLTQNGLRVLQVNGDYLTEMKVDHFVSALVVSLKSRSCPREEAIELSLQALRWLQEQGAEKIFFKYCSTFDSTPEGNIGPVADALLQAMHQPQTLICPALPVNQRTVYQGNLFVADKLLHESHMKDHPLNPMRDANLMRLIEEQSAHKAGLLAYETIQKGQKAISARLKELESQACRYVVADAVCDADLAAIAEATWPRMNLFTGGSGLGAALAKQICSEEVFAAKTALGEQFERVSSQVVRRELGVVLAGSCSQATLGQIAAYQQLAPSFALDVEESLVNAKTYVIRVLEWYQEQVSFPAPLIYSSVAAGDLQHIQQKFGAEKAQTALEDFFALLSTKLADIGLRNFIVAGGETSGVVIQALRVPAFFIGEQIAPGVPWVQSVDQKYNLALKSGNFGGPDFFMAAQELYCD